jgi:hypothetical protein
LSSGNDRIVRAAGGDNRDKIPASFRFTVSLLVAALTACAPRPAGEPGTGADAGNGPPEPHAFHGVIVWLGPATFDTVPVAFDAVWLRTPLANDSVWSFSATDRVSGRVATGYIHQDSLSWSLIHTVGNVTVVEEYRGAIDADRHSRGCGGVASRTPIGPPAGQPRAAFVLAPRSSPRPDPGDAPTAECRPNRAPSP